MLSWAWTILIIPLTWLFGRIHMLCVPEDKHKKMGKDRLKWRIGLYSVPMGVTWAVYPMILKPLSTSPDWAKSLVLFLTVVLVFLCLCVLGLSYLLVFWYEEIPEISFRKRGFYWVLLPVLYGSLSLYWVAVILIWVCFAASFAKLI